MKEKNFIKMKNQEFINDPDIFMQFFIIFCKIDKIEIYLFLKINQNLKYYKDNNQM